MLTETGIYDQVIKMKYDVPNNNINKLDTYETLIDDTLRQIH